MINDDNLIKVYCNVCEQYTNHKIVKSVSHSYTPEDYPDMDIDYAHVNCQIIECVGCDIYSFRQSWETSEDFDPNTDLPEITVEIYPKRTFNVVKEKPLNETPKNIRRLYKETINSYNNDNHTLCAAGLRALVEIICEDKKIKSGKVKQKIKNKTVIRTLKPNEFSWICNYYISLKAYIKALLVRNENSFI